MPFYFRNSRSIDLPNLLRRFTLVSAGVSVAALVLSVFVQLQFHWSNFSNGAIFVGVGFAMFALASESWRQRQNDQRLDELLRRTSQQARNIRKLRHGFYVFWIFSVLAALIGLVSFVVDNDLFTPLSIFYSAIFALFAWLQRRRLQIEMIVDPRQRELALAKARINGVAQAYWFAVCALPVFLAMLTLNHLSMAPLPAILTVSNGAISWWMIGVAGAAIVANGVRGSTTPSAPNCFRCSYEYDIKIKPTLCPECGVVLSEKLVKWTLSNRSPKLITVGCLYLFFAGLGLLTSMSAIGKSMLLTTSPTKRLIAELGADGHSYSDDQTNWTELMTRLPLAPADQQRLIERAISVALGEHTVRFTALVGFDQWVATTLPTTTSYEQTISDLLSHAENDMKSAPNVIESYHSAAKYVYLIDLADLPGSQRDRAIEIAFPLTTHLSYGVITSTIQTWLYQGYLSGVLGDENEEQLLSVMQGANTSWLVVLSAVRASTVNERRRLAELQLKALDSPVYSAMMRPIATNFQQLYVVGDLTEEQSHRVLKYTITTMKYAWGAYDILASTPEEDDRLTTLRLAALGNPRLTSVWFIAKPLFSDYVHGALTAEQADALRAALPGIMKRNGSLAMLGLYSALRKNSFTEDDRVRLADLAIAHVQYLVEDKKRKWDLWWNWLDNQSARGLLTDEQKAIYEQRRDHR